MVKIMRAASFVLAPRIGGVYARVPWVVTRVTRFDVSFFASLCFNLLGMRVHTPCENYGGGSAMVASIIQMHVVVSERPFSAVTFWPRTFSRQFESFRKCRVFRVERENPRTPVIPK